MLVHVLLGAESGADPARLRRLIRQRDVSLAVAETRPAVRERLAHGDFDLLVVSRGLLPDPPDPLISSVRALPERPEIVVLTDRDDAEERASLLALGCLGVLDLGLGDDRLRDALHALFDRQRSEAINRLRADRPEEEYSLADFVSDSPAMQMFLTLARKIVRGESSVLILGETGVGKERLARAIHMEGPRSRGPFMAINCGALPESLLESELFGHEEGAFTGATRARKGYFELAHRGTLFLDEIGEMPAHLQVKILRALDEQRIYRVGGEKPTPVSVRIMAATNKDLEAEMRENRFRPDLFFRIAVVTLTIPPLRERRADIAKLVESYLEHFRAQTRKPIVGVSTDAMSIMTRYHWPGNVRELVNAIERAFLVGTSDEIRAEDLPVRIVQAVRGGEADPLGGARTITGASLLSKPLSEARKEVVQAFETRYLSGLLESTGGRIGETARRAGINERSLYDLMKRRGLRKEKFKAGRSSESARRDGSIGGSTSESRPARRAPRKAPPDPTV